MIYNHEAHKGHEEREDNLDMITEWGERMKDEG